MGMFDYVVCRAELPTEVEFDPNDWDAGAFQTKAFHNLMETYEITLEGRLRILEDGIAYELHQRDGSLYSGEFNFYTSGKGGRWYEFIAKFKDGQLQEIVDDSARMEEALKQKGV